MVGQSEVRTEIARDGGFCYAENMKYKHWKYKNTTLLIISLVVLFFIADSTSVKDFISKIGELGYFGAFIIGIFFVSVFTVVPASIVLLYFARNLDPFLVALFAGLGAMVGDYLIFKFLRDHVFEELSDLFNSLGGSHLSKIFNTPHFAWTLPLMGALIVASPLPDEIGLGLMGLSRIKTWQVILMTFILNATGILILALIASSQ